MEDQHRQRVVAQLGRSHHIASDLFILRPLANTVVEWAHARVVVSVEANQARVVQR